MHHNPLIDVILLLDLSKIVSSLYTILKLGDLNPFPGHTRNIENNSTNLIIFLKIILSLFSCVNVQQMVGDAIVLLVTSVQRKADLVFPKVNAVKNRMKSGADVRMDVSQLARIVIQNAQRYVSFYFVL